MARSQKFPQIEDEIADACIYLIENYDIIVSDLKKELATKLAKGLELYKGFKRQAFIKAIKKDIAYRIREMYTFEKRWYMTSEMAMLIEANESVSNLTYQIIKEVLDE